VSIRWIIPKPIQGGKRKNPRQVPEPRLGIFWLVGGKLIMESAPISAAEPYGGQLTHPRSHSELWRQHQRAGTVPADMKYDQPPRGRVMFDTRSQRFTLLADRCILQNKNILRRIMLELKLPENTETDTDNRYRCCDCLRGGTDR
jgi:hypothetical protein